MVAALCTFAPPGAARADTGDEPAAADPTDALGDVARDLYEQGRAAYQKGDFEKAYAAFLGAWRLKNHWQIAVNLGATAMRLGKPREAAEYLAYYMREAPPSDDPATRREAQETLAGATKKIGTIEIAASEPGAEIKVDGESSGTSPLPHAIYVEPGRHRLTARKGQVSADKEIVIEAGTTQTVALTLAPPEPPPAGARKEIVIAGAALTLVAAGIGVGLVAGATEKGNAALKQSDEIYNAGRSCVAGANNYDARCEAVKSESSTADTMNRAGIGVLFGSGAVAAGTLAYWLLARRGTEKPAVALVPVVSPGGAGAVFQGQF